MDQQAARGSTSQPYRWQEARSDWRRPAVTAVILAGLCGGMLAMPTPSVASATGLNPVVCGLLMMIAGDAAVYYPAQSASSLVVYERGHLSGPEIFRFGLWMTLVAYLVVLVVALPYWAAVGEPLVMRSVE